MTQKIQFAIDNTKNRIEWEQKTIDKCITSIRERVASATEYDIITFLPGKIDDLKEAMERRKALEEQLHILKFIQKEN